MRLYQINKGKLSKIKEESFRLENDLQKLVEKNIETLMGLRLIKSEFYLRGKRFDTLAFDPKNKSFVIIEYKRDKNSNMVDQGYEYLNILEGNKEAGVLALNNRFKKHLNVPNINWGEDKIIFISSAFTISQRKSLNDDLRIELLEARKYGKNLISFKKIQKVEDLNINLEKSLSSFKKVNKKTKNYTEEDLLSKTSEEIKELYAQFRSAIINLDKQIEISPQQLYIAFKKDSSNICDIEIYKKKLTIFVNAKKGQLDDSKKLFENIAGKGHHGNGDYRINISNTKDLEYIMSVIKQLL